MAIRDCNTCFNSIFELIYIVCKYSKSFLLKRKYSKKVSFLKGNIINSIRYRQDFYHNYNKLFRLHKMCNRDRKDKGLSICLSSCRFFTVMQYLAIIQVFLLCPAGSSSKGIYLSYKVCQKRHHVFSVNIEIISHFAKFLCKMRIKNQKRH